MEKKEKKKRTHAMNTRGRAIIIDNPQRRLFISCEFCNITIFRSVISKNLNKLV